MSIVYIMFDIFVSGLTMKFPYLVAKEQGRAEPNTSTNPSCFPITLSLPLSLPLHILVCGWTGPWATHNHGNHGNSLGPLRF